MTDNSLQEEIGEKKDIAKRNNKLRSSDGQIGSLADNHNGGVTDNDPSCSSGGGGTNTVLLPTEEGDFEEEEGEDTEDDDEEGDEDEDEEGGGEKKVHTSEDQPRPAPRQLAYTRPSAETIVIECSDDELLEVEKAVAVRMSVAIRKKLETLEPNGILQLDNITGRALTKVMEYCHVHTAPHIISMDLKTWDDKFVKLDPGTLCELASAAYHLEIKPLVDLTCQAIAQLLKGKSPAEIRRTFNILYDFNPEDDAPPPTMRDKLRNKLCNPKRREKAKQQQQQQPLAAAPRETVDTRSVDELVSFINQGKTTKSKSKSSKAAKRARQRERKKQRKNQEKLKGSQEKAESESSPNKEKEKEKNNKVGLKRSQDKQDQTVKQASKTESNHDSKEKTSQGSKNGLLKKSGDIADQRADPVEVEELPRDLADSGPQNTNKNPNSKKRGTGESSPRNGKSERSLKSSSGDEPITPDDDIWQEDEDDMDPELKAQQDREVEEFRMRLEQINNTTNRTRIPLPSTLSLALIDSLKG